MGCKCSFLVFPLFIMMVLHAVLVTGDKSIFSDSYSAPQQQYSAPQDQYSAPQQQYSAPQDQYSAPQQQYSAPQNQYSAPPVMYGQGPVKPTSSGVKPFKFSFWAIIVVFKFLFFALLFILYQITYVGNYTQKAKPIQPAPPKGQGAFRNSQDLNSNISVLTRQFLKQLLEGDFDINKLIEKLS